MKEPHASAKENDRKTSKRVRGPAGPPTRFVFCLSFAFVDSCGSLIVVSLFCLYVIFFHHLSFSSSVLSSLHEFSERGERITRPRAQY